jgi:uncharacterized protein YnzC (UPF0291/DUF896 family)
MSKLEKIVVEFRKQQAELRRKYLPYHKLQGKSQIDIIKWHLEEFGEITNEQANLLYSIRHLPKRMEDFKKKYPLYQMENVTVKGVTWLGEECDWQRYILKGIKIC